MANPEIHNTGNVSLFVGHDRADMMIGGKVSEVLSGGFLAIPGLVANLEIHNEVGALASATWSLQTELSTMPLSLHPGHASEFGGKIVGVPNSTASLSITAPFALTVTSLSIWAPVAPVSAAGTYLLTATKNGGNNLLAAANYDLETLVAGTIDTAAITATVADYTLAAADTIDLVATSNHTDLADGTFYVLFGITKA
jgi:hypothetical protein